jgi:hypothetical protein
MVHQRSLHRLVSAIVDESTATPETTIPLQIPAPHSERLGDTTLLICYADLCAIDRLLSDTPLPWVALEFHRSEARAARLRERNDAGMVVAIYNDRRAIWEGLLATLDATIELEREGPGFGQDSESAESKNYSN